MKIQLPNSTTAESRVEPKFGTVDTWCRLSGMSRRITYDKLGLGYLKARKVGSRTLIDIEHGLAWLRSLPPAQFASPRRRAGLQRQEVRRVRPQQSEVPVAQG